MSLQQNLYQIKQLIKQSELDFGREPGSVLLLAVSKQQSIEAISQLFHLGVTHFGESYFQEAQQKINALKNMPICWHFIGPIQSNKAKGIAISFSWVHSVSRLKIAQYLNEYRPTHLAPLNICLQISLVDEKTKSGIPPEDAAELALAISQLPHLKLRGLMTIPPPQHNTQTQYDLFIQLNQLMHTLNQELGLNMDTLSMGMSDDLVSAIEAGTTIVRVGRALFGERQK
ncbi:YggS family pyridoxal phosphate-dependent enzyme [Legionella anisa]|uniref:Pyridoxal phosphate homeostasis protein n=1 Tax=Legionella anisa TaxID=28082 RepID=A0AAX0WYK4_9GAMM|nr:YggS family pyridoxal phosphate-dependent enzyme [Legionella anisa]AWN73775.1 YggS family pyridoxal phosphate-dependent enzyme [Legionella anisa]KTC70391.1 pyridoxal-5'-phosphate dependent enzyme family transporter protein [Legionella anisa]MBN5937646.1 YggS family pyridoxal phosphate-dependent enzyme [Legionella anisa]MCW8426676.1 YggS family pyridoxal phosphate-dependent enzyme [Legionella anisa]MCW8448339.1 YggS family pyridoxal phosphate-dependent enzyme [Legionella anisa]